MPAVVSEASVVRASGHSQAAANRSQNGAEQASSPFSDLLDSCEATDTTAPDSASAPTESKSPEAAPREGKAESAEAPKAEPGKDTAQTPTELMLAIAAVGQQVGLPAGLQARSEGKEAQPAAEIPPTDAVLDEAKSDSDASVPEQAGASEAIDAPAVAPPAPPLPVAVPVPSPAPAVTAVMAEADAAVPAPTESVSGIKPAATAAKVIAGDAAVAVDPAVDAAVAEATPVAAKTAAPTGEAVEKAPSEVAGKKRAAQADKPADVKAETTSDSKTATTAASPDRGASATKPAADAEPAVQTAASRPGDPTVNAAKRDTETPDSTPKLTAAQASPDATLNSTALPAPAVAHAPLHVAQASTHQPGASDAIPVAGLAVEIAAHAQNGKNHFEIRLDPPELGRIDVRLDIDSDGQVTSHLRVERAETLDLLRRDAPSLERALQQAGLKTSDSGLQFSLRDQSFSQREQGRDMPAMARIVVPDDKLAPVETQRHYGRLASLGSGVDIRV